MAETITKSMEAHAKINLFLEITGKRADGYHTIDSVMHKIPISDTVTLSFDRGSNYSISLCCDSYGLGNGEENIAFRAARAYDEAYFVKTGRHTGGILIDIKKRIPMAAGMAGGSADAASVLLLLDSVCGRELSEEELLSIGASLGADVPFCMSDRAMRCTGIGEIMTPCSCLPDCRVVVALGRLVKISTGAAYAAIDAVGDRKVRENDMCAALESGSLDVVCDSLYNVFETVNPETEAIRRIMLENGARGASLSGSGPAVFGLFPIGVDTAAAENALKQAGCRVYA